MATHLFGLSLEETLGISSPSFLPWSFLIVMTWAGLTNLFLLATDKIFLVSLHNGSMLSDLEKSVLHWVGLLRLAT